MSMSSIKYSENNQDFVVSLEPETFTSSSDSPRVGVISSNSKDKYNAKLVTYLPVRTASKTDSKLFISKKQKSRCDQPLKKECYTDVQKEYFDLSDVSFFELGGNEDSEDEDGF